MAATWHRSRDVLARRLADGWLLLCPGIDEPVHLGTTAADIWDHLDAPCTTDDLVRRLERRYGPPNREVVDDLDAALHRLEGLGLAERVP